MQALVRTGAALSRVIGKVETAPKPRYENAHTTRVRRTTVRLLKSGKGKKEIQLRIRLFASAGLETLRYAAA